MSLQKIESERVKALVGLFAEAANHVPEDKTSWKPEGVSKSAKELLEHIAAANQGFAALIQGKDLGIKIDKNDRGNISMQTESFPDAIAAVKASGQALSETMKSVTDDQLAQSRTMPWGEAWEMPRLLTTASTHIAYHWGQLAYLQTMWGDKQDYM